MIDNATWYRENVVLLYDLERESGRSGVYHKIANTGMQNPLTGEMDEEREVAIPVVLLSYSESEYHNVRLFDRSQLQAVGFEVGDRVFVVRYELIGETTENDKIEFDGHFYKFQNKVTLDPKVAYVIHGRRLQNVK